MGVAPTMKPVLRSCEVAPAIGRGDADDGADAERDGRVGVAGPAERRRRCVQVRISVAIVMPEIGFDELPMRPVMRDETVAKKKPNSTMRMAASTLPCVGGPGAMTRKIASSERAAEHDGQRHVALGSRAGRGAAPRR